MRTEQARPSADVHSPDRVTTWQVFLAPLAVLVLLAAPIAVSEAGLPFVGSSYGKASEPIELFAFLAAAAAIAFGWQASRRAGGDWDALAPPLLGCVVAACFALLLADLSVRSNDYRAYEEAARTISRGANPYLNQPYPYIYPPLPARALLIVHHLLALALPGTADARLWDHVFYLYQACQWLLLVLGWTLAFRFSRRLGLSPLVAAIAVTALFLVNAPLLRTLRFNQINLWVLDATLLALLTLEARPAVAGVALQVGAMIKLYPLALLPAALLGGGQRSLAGLVLGGAALLALTTGGGRDWELWSQYLAFAPGFPVFTHFRNNSLLGLFTNLAGFLGLAEGPFVTTAVFAATLALLAWFGWRAYLRERSYHAAAGDDQAWARRTRLYGHALDGMALATLLSPSVWTHHFVLTLPLALWAVAMGGRTRPRLVAMGILLVFTLPTIEVFPLGHHHALGLLLLVHATDARSVHASQRRSAVPPQPANQPA